MKTIQTENSVQRVDDSKQNNLLRWDGSTVKKCMKELNKNKAIT